MFLITHSVISMISITSAFSLVYFYIWGQNKKRYIALWGFSWVIYSLSFVFDLFYFRNPGTLEIFIVIKQVFFLVSSLLLLHGTYICFHLDKRAVYFGIAFSGLSTLWLGIAFYNQFSISLLMLPASILLCLIYLWTGIIFLVQPPEYENKKILENHAMGWMFIIAGIHKGFYPFVQPEFYFSSWNYVSSAILVTILNVCILLVYFQNTQKELVRSEKQFRLLAENAKDLIYHYRLADKLGYEYVSPSSLEITGYTPEEFYNDPNLFVNNIHPDDLPLFEMLTESAEKFPKPLALRWITKDKKTIWIEPHNVTIYDDKKKPIAIEGIIRDITERKKIEENLRCAEHSRKHLLANISHELHTPITLILGYIKVLLDDLATNKESRNRYLKLIYDKAIFLQTLIKDLFELAKFESKEIIFNFEYISIKQLMEQIYQKYALDIENAGFQFEKKTIFTNNKEQFFVYIDQTRIEQVFANLLFNAIKHTNPRGKIILACELIDSCNKKRENSPLQNQDEVIFSVADNGKGIEKKELLYIFDRFYKIDKSRNSKLKGSGLGLPIAQEIIKTHGGEMWAESHIDKGSTFYFTLPIHHEVNSNSKNHFVF